MPQFPKNILAQEVIASCVSNRIQHVVISPGSRNAPLTIGFNNHDAVKAYSIVDERCAAFFALGIAQQLQKPVALVCTSGSALLNYFPAISEAYYSNIPLIIISADRPKHMIDIGDGQTIRQENVYGDHSFYNANLIVDADDNLVHIDAAIRTAIIKQGPVHINVPFDEPLYETVDSIMDIEVVDTTRIEIPIDVDFLENYAKLWNSSSKKMVLIGVHQPDELLQIQIDKLIKDPSVIVLTETTSNVYHQKFINSIDQTIFPFTTEEFENFKPDILLTFGGMVVSKKIKQFLRASQPKHHWHVGNHKAYDTFFCLNKHFEISAQLFFSQFFFLTKEKASTYQEEWLAVKSYRAIQHKKYLEKVTYSDLKVFEKVSTTFPKESIVHFSNSSTIRYAQLFDLDSSLKVYCNRGTSGIDGSSSTAVGTSSVAKEPVVLVTGDISFFYDSNALWNNAMDSNYRIIIINNDGGGIFRYIPGPQTTNVLDYFETPHGLDASKLAAMYNFDYLSAKNMKEVTAQLKSFYDVVDQPRILEIFTPREENDKILKQYFSALK